MKKCILLLIYLGINLNVLAPNLSNIFVQEYEKKVVTLAKKKIEREIYVRSILEAIKIIESNGDYNSKGKSKEYGAYQFSKTTWINLCKEYFNEVLDITIPENQDKIARMKVESLIYKGYNLEEIASVWNCGKRTWKNKVGINKYGVKYDTPKYVKKFLKIWKEIYYERISKYSDCEDKEIT